MQAGPANPSQTSTIQKLQSGQITTIYAEAFTFIYNLMGYKNHTSIFMMVPTRLENPLPMHLLILIINISVYKDQ